ncbi:MAG: DHHA1 domain-containing protein, partial [Halobaculum sp.]
PEEAAALADRVTELESELDDLRGDVLDARLGDLDTVERDGHRWRIGSLDGFESNAVGEAAQDRVGDTAGDGGSDGESADVIAVVGEGDAPFVVVATDGTLDAGDVVDDVTDEFGGGGGGGPTFAQGGGIAAETETVVSFLRDEL